MGGLGKRERYVKVCLKARGLKHSNTSSACLGVHVGMPHIAPNCIDVQILLQTVLVEERLSCVLGGKERRCSPFAASVSYR